MYVSGGSLVVQQLRIHLPVQGTWVRSLVQEDPTCCRATKPVCHSYWSHTSQSPGSAIREATSMRSPCTATIEYSLLIATRKSTHTAMKTQHSQKTNKLINIFFNVCFSACGPRLSSLVTLYWEFSMLVFLFFSLGGTDTFENLKKQNYALTLQKNEHRYTQKGFVHYLSWFTRHLLLLHTIW